MRKRVVKTAAYFGVLLIFAFLATGCAIVPSLNLTPEQETLVAEYAAGKLIEYVKGHPGGLMILEDVDRTEVNPGLKKEEPEPEQQPLPPLPQSEPNVPEEGIPDGEADELPQPSEEAMVDAPEDVSTSVSVPIADAIGIEGASIEYERFETASVYPDDSELAFTMKAAEGKELLIVHFNLSNPGDSDINAHTDSTDFKVRLRVNGGDKIRCDVTFLDNDLMNYDGLLTPGASVDSVLVFEVDKGTEVSSLDLIVIRDGQEQNYQLTQG